MDDMLIRFNNSARLSFSENEDAAYKPGFGKASLSSQSSDNVTLAINTVPYPKSSERIPLVVTATKDTTYRLDLSDLNQVPRLFDIWLADSYKKDSVNLRNSASYSFDIKNSDSASYGSKRFALVIGQNPLFAYKLVAFDAQKSTENKAQVLVTWTAQNEENYTHFAVERSTDNGKTFAIIESINSTGQGNYSFIDKLPVNGLNLYRLRQEDINSAISYSKVNEVMYTGLANNIAGNLMVYPNPVANTINLRISSNAETTGNYSITIVGVSGQTIKQASTSQSTWQSPANDLIPGTYMIKVINSKNNSLVGNARFVKL